MEQLTYRDLIVAMVQAYAARAWHPDLTKWYSEKFRLMVQEFGLPAEMAEYPRGLWFVGAEKRFFLPMMTKLASIDLTYWSGWLEYNPSENEEEIHRKYRDKFDAALKEAREQGIGALGDILASIYPDAPQKTTSWERLHELGLGPIPDEADYI